MAVEARPGWRDLLAGANAARSLVLAGGVGLHAVNIFIVTTILPSVVADIGGLAYYAWNTTLFVVGSIVGSAVSPRALEGLAPRGAYLLAVALFALGTLVCAAAPSMPALLAGRSLQGLGGGMLVALSYAMIRQLFPAALWSRAIALVSGMWGAAALTGPLVGGFFAQLGAWRAAFWALLPLAAGFAALSGRVFGRTAHEAGRVPLPIARLALLALAVLSVSAGSLTRQIWLNVVGFGAAVAFMTAMARLDDASPARLLPRAAFRPATPLGATYATMALLVAGTTTIIFVPYLLQVLHGLSPLAAGYLTVVEALGWTGAAVATSGEDGAGARRMIAAGPVVMVVGLLGLALSLPSGRGASLAVIAIWLMMVGAGVGMVWAHLASRVLAVAAAGERDLAAASISTVQLLATAFGSALAGMVANLSGLSDLDSVSGAAGAARWLFAVFTAAPVLAGVAVSTVLARPAEQPHGL